MPHLISYFLQWIAPLTFSGDSHLIQGTTTSCSPRGNKSLTIAHPGGEQPKNGRLQNRIRQSLTRWRTGWKVLSTNTSAINVVLVLRSWRSTRKLCVPGKIAADGRTKTARMACARSVASTTFCLPRGRSHSARWRSISKRARSTNHALKWEYQRLPRDLAFLME